MCQACIARGLRIDDHDARSAGAALATAPEAASKAVTDERAILTTQQNGDDNWRWNAESPLGTGVVVTYSFARGGDLPAVTDGSKNAYGANGFSAFSAAQQAGFRAAAAEFVATAGIILVEVASGGMIDVYNAHNSSVGGWAWIPYVTSSYVSEVDLVIDYSGSLAKGGYGYYLLLHELGHAMGLAHPHEDGGDAFVLSSAVDSTASTVMSYNYMGGVTGLQHLDQDALQTLYGSPIASSTWTFAMEKGAIAASGGNGADTLSAARSAQNAVFDYVVRAGGGNDTVTGEAGDDFMRGDNGLDRLFGLGGNDHLRGGRHDDRIDGGSGGDVLNGGSGADQITGGSGNDSILGRTGWDTLSGDAGDDRIDGFWGRDVIDGGLGDDTIIGGRGHDTLTGGGGTDVFVFSANSKKDTITDFDASAEKLDFRGTGFDFTDVSLTAVSGGVLVEVGRVDITLQGVALGDIGADDFLFN